MNADSQTLSLLPEAGTPLASLPAADWLDVLPPEADCLRDYQRELLGATSNAMRRQRRVLVQGHTGMGKTTVFCILIAAAIAAGLRVLVLATRTRLVRQIHDRLDSFSVPHGIVAAAMPGYVAWSRKVQIASVDTLYRRCLGDKRMPMPAADVVIFDEAHLALGASRQAILDSYPFARIFGFTATPALTSGANLRDQFDELVMGPSMADLIATGMLVKPRIFAKPVMTARELRDVPKDSKTKDYATGKLSGLMSRPKLVGDVVANWLRIANGKRTLVFACDKSHGAQLLTEFLRAGVPAEQLTDEDDEAMRESTIARLEAGTTQVVVNCFLLSYGIDIPLVDCIVLARPTRSVVLFLQSIGRGMRPAPGKDHVILIDHGRVVENLGLPTYDHDWSLDGLNVNDAAQAIQARQSADEKPRTCSECHCMWVVSDEGSACPHCGWQPKPKPRHVETADATLHETHEAPIDFERMETFFRESCQWYANRWPDRWTEKEKSGRWWAWCKTREYFKRPEDERMPSRYWTVAPLSPSIEIAGLLLSQIIRYAKGQKKAQRQQSLQAPM